MLRKKRNPFHKLGYNENHIPHQGGYQAAKMKKPRLAQWDNYEHLSWPPKLPRPTTHKNKTLLSHIDSEYRKKIEEARPFKMPPYRSGDAVEITMFTSLSEGTYNVIPGIIYSKKMPNNLRQSFKLATILSDT